MTLLTHRGDGPGFRYAGQSVHILAGRDDRPPGFAAMEMTIPARFGGPIPHAHDEFDEAIYVLRGRLQVSGDGPAEEAMEGSMFVALRFSPVCHPTRSRCWTSTPGTPAACCLSRAEDASLCD